jgi:ribokinase
VRAAGCVVATTRVVDLLASAGVQLDAVVGSSRDTAERYRPIDPRPRYVVSTAGARGGSWIEPDGSEHSWAPTPPPGPVRDAYGAGDSFAGGLTFALARGDDIHAAVQVGAHCGATCMTGRGPYERQLTARDLAAIGTHRRG